MPRLKSLFSDSRASSTDKADAQFGLGVTCDEDIGRGAATIAHQTSMHSPLGKRPTHPQRSEELSPSGVRPYDPLIMVARFNVKQMLCRRKSALQHICADCAEG
jgi:hypothetical protein